ncbi:methylmalonate-semialdehyde dehydrogenase (acylating) [Cladophialophora immunda]|uniref:methylmalonate-semialdehyde dehydrogenase (CoA acylating) n=1 Tax=Cladophialophora immunda TaxID=569365 RepID=A0A0D2BXQ5_9EURO|nr:methylmalonate-semialdehyde dehydrogenase (acylating) [Cladophialophora immunda]KIW23095.1 methylmalonate-semialdehyde dehydrogenase (acylating) [Cladophialophora immunda]
MVGQISATTVTTVATLLEQPLSLVVDSKDDTAGDYSPNHHHRNKRRRSDETSTRLGTSDPSRVTVPLNQSTSTMALPIPPTTTQNLINNEFGVSKTRVWMKVLDPASQKLLARVPESTPAEIQKAVTVAEAAQSAWASLPIAKRKAMLFSLLHVLQQHTVDFQQSLQLEVGKTLQDAESEFERGIDAIHTACSATAEMNGKHWTTNSTETYTIHQPVGVCVVITPFNFPFMIPLWSIPYAVITGNTVVLKPSEKAPSTANLLGRCFVQAGFPPGVVNIIHGSSGAVDKLLSQPVVSAVSFVGSELAGERVYEHAKATRKRIQVEVSGKNHGIVLEDAPKTQTLYAIAGSAFGAAGQRCMALSVMLCVGSTKAWIDDLAQLAGSLKVGCGSDPGTEVGPLITAAAKERVEDMIDLAEAEGAHVVLDGRNYCVPEYPEGNFVGPTIITKVQTSMQCYQDEIFGPVLVCIEVDTLDEAIEIANENRYGNGCSLFTTDPVQAQTFQRKINIGQIGINVPVLAASGPVARTANKDSFLGDNVCGRSPWQFFTMPKTVTALWR